MVESTPVNATVEENNQNPESQEVYDGPEAPTTE